MKPIGRTEYVCFIDDASFNSEQNKNKKFIFIEENQKALTKELYEELLKRAEENIK